MVTYVKIPAPTDPTGITLTLVRRGAVERMFRSHVEDIGRLIAAYNLGHIDRSTFVSETARLNEILGALIENGTAESALRHADEVILQALIGDDPLPGDPRGPEEIDRAGEGGETP